MKKLGILLIFFFNMSNITFADVWKTKSGKKGVWTSEYEKKYQDWISSKEVNEYMFKTGEFSGLRTDCADFIYALRIIFAYKNELKLDFPGVYTQEKGKRVLYSNKMKQFDHIDNKKQRVMKFIRAVNNVTSTSTIFYSHATPIKLENLKVGDFILSGADVRFDQNSKIFRVPRHAAVIKSISDTGYIETLESTTPAKVRVLKRLTMKGRYPKPRLDYANVDKENNLKDSAYAQVKVWGYFRFKRDNDSISKEEILDFDDYRNQDLEDETFKQAQQAWFDRIKNNKSDHLENGGIYGIGHWALSASDQFYNRFQKIYKKREISIEEITMMDLKNACIRFKERLSGVYDAIRAKYKLKNNRRCFTKREYNIYSTPVADSKTYNAIQNGILFEEYLRTSTPNSQASLITSYINGMRTDEAAKQASINFCHVPMGARVNGRFVAIKLDLGHFKKAYEDKKLSNNPHDGVSTRWGLGSYSNDKDIANCPTY